MKKRTIGAIAGVALMMAAVVPQAFAQDDLILFNSGSWLANYSTSSGFGPLPGDDGLTWGTTGDKPLVGDINGDGIQDVVLARPAASYTWYGGHGVDVGGISKFSAGGSALGGWGSATGTPHLGDTNGDGIQDIILVDNFNWLSFTSSSAGIGGGAANNGGGFGTSTLGDYPLLGDFNGDGATDLGVWRSTSGGTFIKPTVGGLFGSGSAPGGSFGNASWAFAAPLVGDINGDGRDDMLLTADVSGALFWRAAFGQADGSLDLSDQSNQLNWGATSMDIPMLADINGDGMDDVVIRRSGGTYITSFTGAGGVIGTGPTSSIGWGNSAFTPTFADMTVIPEPATLGLFALVGGGMLWFRKRFSI
ncbi:MAG: hypothetical protein DRP64_04065 [Verrucomicrobia bacterium]|nr:MAG: hypothetical protein DRP64_04065 [Verrucomicrobiota bacterium]